MVLIRKKCLRMKKVKPAKKKFYCQLSESKSRKIDQVQHFNYLFLFFFLFNYIHCSTSIIAPSFKNQWAMNLLPFRSWPIIHNNKNCNVDMKLNETRKKSTMIIYSFFYFYIFFLSYYHSWDLQTVMNYKNCISIKWIFLFIIFVFFIRFQNLTHVQMCWKTNTSTRFNYFWFLCLIIECYNSSFITTFFYMFYIFLFMLCWLPRSQTITTVVHRTNIFVQNKKCSVPPFLIDKINGMTFYLILLLLVLVWWK